MIGVFCGESFLSFLCVSIGGSIAQMQGAFSIYSDPLLTNPTDQAIVWVLSSLWICIGAVRMRRRFPDVARSEALLSSVLCAFRSLALFVCIILMVGLVFLYWLKVVSIFWFFWEVMFASSLISLFWCFPTFALVLSCWVLFGRFKEHYSKRSIILFLQCLFVAAVDVLLFYAIQIVAGS